MPVWTDKRHGAWVCRVGQRSVNYTGPSLNLIQRNVPQSNLTWPNKSNTVTVTIFGSLYKKKNAADIGIRPPVYSPTCPTDSSSHFCPKKQHLSLATHRVFIMKINHCHGQPSGPRRQWTFPQKVASIPMSERVRLTGGMLGNTLNTGEIRCFEEPQCQLSVWIHGGSSLRHRCFTLCESPLVEDWRTAAAAFMCLFLCEWG